MTMHPPEVRPSLEKRATGAPAWRLEVRSGPLDGQSWKLGREAAVIGRGPGADHGFPDDRAMQDRHARIEITLEGKLRITPEAGATLTVGETEVGRAVEIPEEKEFLCGSTWFWMTRVRAADAGTASVGDVMARLDAGSHQVLSRAAARSEPGGHRFLTVDHLILELLPLPDLLAASARHEAAARLAPEVEARSGSYRLLDTVFAPRTIQVLRFALRSAGGGKVTPAHLWEAVTEEGRSFAFLRLRTRGFDGSLAARPAAAAAVSDPDRLPLGPVLASIGRDLTALARAGKLPPLVGRERELKLLVQILARSRKRNPIVVGEAGTGKTCLIEGLAQMVVSNDPPPLLAGKQIVEVPPGTLVAGTQYRGQLEDKVLQLLKEANRPDLILFIDEIHMLVGAGRAEGQMMDVGNLLKPALARDEIVVIGATTHSEFRKSIEKDPALERRFDPIFLTEPLPEEALEILRGIVPRLEEHHAVSYSGEAIEAAVHLSVQYLPERNLPDKAIDLLDRAAARARSLPGSSGGGRIQRADIAATLSDWIGRTVHDGAADESSLYLDLETRLAGRVVGQESAIGAVCRVLRASRAGLRASRGPQGVFLFTGPTGVGKTELARALAQVLHGGEQALVHLDMSEYQEPHSVSRLTGAPPGYVGHEEGGVLTEAVRRKPASVVLLDEVEKAHPQIYDLCLQIFDEGRLTDSHGRPTDFRGTIVVMTSNLRPEQGSGKRIHGFGGEAGVSKPDARKVLGNHFRPELVNRIDEVVNFEPLEAGALRILIERALEPARTALGRRGVGLDLDASVYDWIARESRSDEFGAREIGRVVQRHLGELLAREILGGKLAPGSRLAARRTDAGFEIGPGRTGAE